VEGVRIVVLIEAGDDSERLVAEAALLAGSRGLIVAVAAVEVPLELPLDTPLPEHDAAAHRAVERARAIGLAHGVAVCGRVARTRAVADAVLEEVERAHADVVVVGMHRAERLGRAEEFLLRHARCRVLVAAS
jgi:nucleotide-binding universal stress UspA family protein